MALCERTSGPRFQVWLEADGPLLVSEFDDDINVPRPATRRVPAPARVVIRKSRHDTGCQAGVVTTRMAAAFQNVNETERRRHATRVCKRSTAAARSISKGVLRLARAALESAESSHLRVRAIRSSLVIQASERWAHQDLNLEPADYEPAALTVELWALRSTKYEV